MSELPIRTSTLWSCGSYPVHFMTQRPIDDLCAVLETEFDQDPRGKAVPALLAAYQAEHQDWRDWVLWSDACYTRNLVARCDAFELLLLAWSPEQKSPIHDHSDQNCWMAVMEGQLEEVHYTLPTSAENGTSVLQRGRSKCFDEGGVAFIDDSIAYHLIQPAGGARAVSLHLYANPIDTCRIFCPDTGKAEDMPLGYYSVRGELVEAHSPEAIRERFSNS